MSHFMVYGFQLVVCYICTLFDSETNVDRYKYMYVRKYRRYPKGTKIYISFFSKNAMTIVANLYDVVYLTKSSSDLQYLEALQFFTIFIPFYNLKYFVLYILYLNSWRRQFGDLMFVNIRSTGSTTRRLVKLYLRRSNPSLTRTSLQIQYRTVL